MERPRAGHIAWAALGASVAAYELLCADDELLTARVQEWRERPLTLAVVTAGIGATALHLLDMLPEAVDPYHYLGKFRQFTRHQ